MYYFVVLVTMMSVALELALVTQFPVLQRLCERFTFFGIIASLFLSWGIGAMFGAAGMIIMTAAVTSTIITVLIYRLRLIDKTRRTVHAISSFFGVVFHPIRAFRKEV